MDLGPELTAIIDNYDQKAGQLLQKFAEGLDARTPPTTIYHYRNYAGLEGILRTATFRIGDIFGLNDPSELGHGFAYAVQELEDCALRSSTDIHHFVTRLKHLNTSDKLQEAGHFCVCCFSSCGDDLGQWRAYADNGYGFAIGFDAKELKDAFIKPIEISGPTRCTHPQTFYITYSDKELRSIQKQLAELVLPAIGLPNTVHPFGKEAFWNELLIGHATNSLLAIFFNHGAYRNESEYRFLQMFPIDQPVPNVKEKPHRDSFSKYREFEWRKLAGTSLRQIIVGPAADETKALQFVKECLDKYEPRVAKIDVRKSPIPYRAQS
jgi:hypothetical protein